MYLRLAPVQGEEAEVLEGKDQEVAIKEDPEVVIAIVVANLVAEVVTGEEGRGVEVVTDPEDRREEVVLGNVVSRGVEVKIAVVTQDPEENLAAKLHRDLQASGVCRELFYQTNINQKKCLPKKWRNGWHNT